MKGLLGYLLTVPFFVVLALVAAIGPVGIVLAAPLLVCIVLVDAGVRRFRCRLRARPAKRGPMNAEGWAGFAEIGRSLAEPWKKGLEK